MNIIIAGAGKIGKTLAQLLTSEGHDLTLIDENHLIRQSSSTWSEAYPVQRNAVIHELGEFLTPAKLFKLTVGEMVKIDLYVWLEGQDIDCTNRITEAQILASIQLSAETETQSGLVPIE